MLATIRFEKTDKIPLWIHVDGELAPRIDQYYGTDAWREKIMGSHIFGMGCGWPNGVPDEIVRDQFGAVVQLGNIPHLVEPALKKPTLNGYRWPEPEELVDVNAFRSAMEARQ